MLATPTRSRYNSEPSQVDRRHSTAGGDFETWMFPEKGKTFLGRGVLPSNRNIVQRTASCKEPKRKGSFKLTTDFRNGPTSKDNRSPPPSPSIQSMGSGHIPVVQDGKFSMMEFAVLFFKESQEKYEPTITPEDASIRGSIKMIENLKLSNLKRKKSFKGKVERNESWSWSEQASMIKWRDTPIASSLLPLDGSTHLNALAVESFIYLMQYMGDAPITGDDTDIDCAFKILKNCHLHPELRDEIYCQVCKQTTNNKSRKAGSCMKGWRLMGILTCWFDCSEILRNYLIHYLQQNAADPAREHHAAAAFSLQNLRKTIRYGGRKNVPSADEIQALTDGRGTKRHPVICPGIVSMVISVKPCMVVQDMIEDICGVLKIKSNVEMDEFALFSILEGDGPKDSAYSRLKKSDYVMDVITNFTLKEKPFHLLFQRTSWFFPLHLDQTECLDMAYAQCRPDFVDGYLLIMERNTITPKLANEVARLAALQHRAADNMDRVTLADIEQYLPGRLLSLKQIKPQHWLNEINKKLADFSSMDPHSCKAHFMDILSRWPLFGSAFFDAMCTSDARVGGNCTVAVNRAGVHFLKHKSHEVALSYPFTEIISTRKIEEKGEYEEAVTYLDIKVGTKMVQKIVRIETEAAVEVAQLIGQYITAINKTTPQS